MSAQANLAGLYPPTGRLIWNEDLNWQPIPIHSVPENIDYLIGGSIPPCVAYENALNEYARSTEMLEFYGSVQPFYEYVSEHAGTIVNDPTALLLLRDSWFCQSIHNLTLPEWTKPLFPNNPEFDDAAMKFYAMSAATKYLSKFRTGFLLKDILDRFTRKAEKTLSPDAKMWMYSTHDSVLFSFLSSLDISDGNFVPYAAAIILELRIYHNHYYVQIFYKNSSTETPMPIRIPRCGNICPLSKMYDIYDDILPKNDFKTECQNIDEK
ncbi:lysosomal acid phosphatase-like [Bradysia coprophila]|uniref:lysosomal acid phosphatase-like n=1 Tax=Bradysia coprophila TaxID=38358 RepID=UPI00187D7452|nr:lysosomal acid phosphatase-like [Bradysia coprophila]